MRTRLLTSMAATLLLVGVGSAAVAITGAEVDASGVVDEVVPGDQDQLQLRDRDELCEPIGDGEQYRRGASEDSTTAVEPDRDQDRDRDQVRIGDQEQLRDQSHSQTQEQLRDQSHSQMQVQTHSQTQVQTQVQTRETEQPCQPAEEAQIQIREQEESQQHSREHTGAPDAPGQH